MKIAIASDHAGYVLKQAIMDNFKSSEFEFIDLGPEENQRVDYPDFAEKVAAGVSRGIYDRGILVCGTGIGMVITANKFPHIRAALCSETYSARMSRLHNDANILALGGRVIGVELAKDIVYTWLTTGFEGGRHELRIKRILEIEQKNGLQ